MSPEPRLLVAVAVASVTAYLFTPVAIRAAGHFDFFDKPKGYKGHAKPIPYLGGGAVLAAFVAAVLLLAGDLGRTGPLLAGVAALWVVGTIDDRRHLSPGIRVAIEVALATGLWATDLGWKLGVGGGLDLALTILWVLAVVNAFNLFDNMDGASSAMAAVVTGAIAILGVSQQDPWLTAVGAALAGACLGFLPYNLARPQAKIFLGDGGSMPIGFAVAALVMTGASSAASGWQALAVGLLLVGVPATDTALVIVSRRRKGISVLTGGRDHLTHRTRRHLGTAHAVAVTLGAFQAVLAAVALVALDVGPSAIITATVLLLGITGAAITLFEREEDRLLAAGEIDVPKAALDTAQAKRERQPDPISPGDFALVIFALGAALSPFALGYYGSDTWVPVGLGVLLAAAMGTIQRPQRLPLQASLALAGLAGIGLLALLSSRWALAPDQAIVNGNRWLVLAASLGLGLVLMRSVRRDVLAVGSLAIGTLTVGGYVLVRMLGDDGDALFLGGRLHHPLGYINGEATVFLMGTWLCFAAAERRQAWLAGLGLGGATALASLSLLSQSRGAAIAAIASIILVVALVPGRQRRAFALLVLGAGVALASGPVLHVYDATMASIAVQAGAPPADVFQRAASFLIAGSVIAGVIWGLATAAFERAGAANQRTVTTAGRGLIAAGAVLVLLVGGVSAGKVRDRLSTQWQAFTNVAPAGQVAAPSAVADSRLISGLGNRYEYWRVAWDTFEREPLSGIGGGNFDREWFAERTVSEDIRQPHSIELQVLSELGLPGGLLLLLVIGGFVAAAVRVRHVARPGLVSGPVAVAALGVPAVWLVQTSVDWQHLIPGTTAVALIMLATLLRQPDRNRASAPAAPAKSGPRTPSIRYPAFAGTVAIALAVATIGATLARQALADHYRADAFAAITTDPATAITQADRSLRLNDAAVRGYYAKAAALARMNRGPDASAVLRQAIRKDRTNPVTWALLGDLATRRGQPAAAQRAYDQALALNPLDPGLQALAGRAGATP